MSRRKTTLCRSLSAREWIPRSEVEVAELTSQRRRSGDIIETILKPQWWVDLKPAAAEAVKVCTDQQHEC